MNNPFQPGDRVRILVDTPYDAPLAAGEIVTVTGVGQKVEPDGSEGPIVVVATNLGEFYLFIDVVEPVEAPVRVEPSLEGLGYLPAPASAEVDDLILEMLADDKDLRAFFLDADTALGAEHEEVSGQLATATDDGYGKPTFSDAVHPMNVATYADEYGDEMQVVYDESVCEHGDRFAAFYISVEDSEDVVIPAEQMVRLVSWFINRIKHSRRMGE